MRTRMITGYNWANLGLFNADLSKLNKFFGYPKPHSETKSSMKALECLDDKGKVMFYYIGKVDLFVQVIGEPIEFKINEEST
jgi:hypothetical protein